MRRVRRMRGIEKSEKKVVDAKDINVQNILASFKEEKVLLDNLGNCYYILPKQPLEEKALVVSLNKALEIASKIQKKADKAFKGHISKIPHKVLVDTPLGKIIKGVGGRYDGEYFFVMLDETCRIISKTLAIKMLRYLKKEYDF